MVSQILPFKSFNYLSTAANDPNVMEPARVTISRNFSSTGGGKSLLHQTFDTKIVGRDAGAPLRSAINMTNQYESVPAGLL